MKRILILFLASLGGVVLVTLVALLALSWAVLTPGTLPDRMVLEVDLQDGLVEYVPDDPILSALGRRQLRTRDVVEAVEQAAGDSRVEALFVRGAGLPGWGTAEALREAVERFRESGKPATYFVETFGELSPGQLSYHLATAFDEIHLQPSGDVGLAPLQMQAFFLAGAFENHEVEPRFDRRWEYKDAQEMFTERGFTPPAREARVAVLASLEASLIDGIAQGRDLSADSARSLLAGGPYSAPAARDAGLVDGLYYLDEVRDRLETGSDGSRTRVGVGRYLDRSGNGWNQGPRVALVYGVGSIHQGRSRYDPLTSGGSMGAATVSAAIRAAVDDPQVRALVFRVDSPGGSWVASDQIRREIRRARERDLPVVVSMGDAAASGGYVVAMEADRIVAHPSTFTGSIGVLAGRLVTREFWASLGIDWDQVQATEGDAFYHLVDDFTPGEWERFQAFLDRVYDDFVSGVSEARGMPQAEVEAVARGRVWSGRDAVDLGLVDRSGGLLTALDVVRELLDEPEDAPLQVATYPAERTLMQLLLEETRGDRRTAIRPGSGVIDVNGPIRALTRLAAQAGLFDSPGPVHAPVWEVPGR